LTARGVKNRYGQNPHGTAFVFQRTVGGVNALINGETAEHQPAGAGEEEMSSSGVWFERKFTLGLPASMFPNVIERLRGTPTRAEELLRGVAPETLTRREGERWSIQEHLGHLLDLGSLDAARANDFAEGRELLTAADLSNAKTHAADHNARDTVELLAAFRAERGELVRRLEEFGDEAVARRAVHPRLEQQMSVTDWAYFVAEHDDHHLAAMTGLLRKFAAR
jgi:uncharacterized damage-inducible protein DinB